MTEPPPDAQPVRESWGLLKFLPPAAATIALGVIGTCRAMALQHGHLPRGARTPPISLFGIQNPEYRVYSVGMTVVAGLFVAMSRPMFRYLNAAAPELEQEIAPIYYSGLVAFAGLATHGVVPLQEDIVAMIQGQPGTIQWATTVHQAAAGVFFSASLYHGWCIVQLQVHHHAARLAIGVKDAETGETVVGMALLSVMWKMMGLVVGVLPFAGAMVYHPANNGKLGKCSWPPHANAFWFD